jgi:hypothetical protein
MHFGRALTAAEVAYLYSGIPTLNIAAAADQVTLSWLAPAGWVLEGTNALSATPASWPAVPLTYPPDGGAMSVTYTNNPATGNQFFRLHIP